MLINSQPLGGSQLAIIQKILDIFLGYICYKYDHRNHCTRKVLPGCDSISMRYDKADRLIFSQDGNQRAKGEWSFFFYDVFGRQTVSGIWKSASLPALDNLVVKTDYTGTGTLAGHTVNLTLPQVELMTVNYYDDHAFTSGVTQLDYVTPPAGYGTQFSSAKGLLTGTRTYRLDDPSRYTASALYYDYRERVVQSHTSNHLGGFDDEYFGYTFTGKLMRHQLVHSAPGKTTQTEVYAYDYGTPATNPTERLLAVTHKLNGSAAVSLAQYTYEEVGRVQTKKLATETSTYSYNVRSWLTGIAGTRFNQTLAYNAAVNGIIPTKALYNGNIGAMKWKAGDETTERGYQFTYDGLDRLAAANYGEGMSLATNIGRFNETVSAYDKMGNIISLQRQCKLDSGDGMMDNLTYTYTGNKLTKVTDAVTAPITYTGAFHFVDRANVTDEYTYDVNGNATKDLNRNITSITYNALNLPSVITFADGNTISYGYDGTGSKLSVAYTAGGTTTKTEYAGNKVYKNGTLSMILTEEGYITLSGSTPSYHYYLKDYQGNNRVVLNQSGTVEQVNHYYPFGGLFGEGLQASNQPYKYNGKELDRELGLDMYDYGARHYDPLLGVWLNGDPLTEEYYSISPYVYVANNPIRYIDPTGEFPIETIWDIGNVVYDVGAAVANHIKGDHKTARSHWGNAALDAGAMLIPYVPAGTSKVIKGGAAGVKALDKVNDTGKAVDKAGDVMKNRVKLKKNTKEAVQNSAKKTPDGQYIDPNTGKPIEKGQEVYGHKTGQEWSKYKKGPENQGKTRQEVIKDQNNPDIYQMEDKKSNASHKYEQK